MEHCREGHLVAIGPGPAHRPPSAWSLWEGRLQAGLRVEVPPVLTTLGCPQRREPPPLPWGQILRRTLVALAPAVPSARQVSLPVSPAAGPWSPAHRVLPQPLHSPPAREGCDPTVQGSPQTTSSS